MRKQKYDITVVGSGFSGSLMALGLDKLGYRVLLVERKSHPRFAIGESSTPIADMILRDIADRYDLDWLYPFSRYGSWREHHPDIACGRKRGFSYYRHLPGKVFRTDEQHARELLVAASADDQQSDTNWYRAEMDAFLVSKVQEAGIDYVDRTTIVGLDRIAGCWKIKAYQHKKLKTYGSNWIIDATGNSSLLCQLGIRSSDEYFRTHSSAVYSHFTNVKPWQSWLVNHGISNRDYPYNPDWSALHHLLDEGWLWMLRFDNGITSAGLVLDGSQQYRWAGNNEMAWQKMIGRYPSLAELFEEATFAEQPGGLKTTHRLQRRTQHIFGEGWIALPHTAGFVDPLHSTGIAHTLSGVERLLYAFENRLLESASGRDYLFSYEKAVFNELQFIDLLVDGCYMARENFELFNAYAMLYFMVAIHYEQKRISGSFDIVKHSFLSANHARLPVVTRECYRELTQLLSASEITEKMIRSFRLKVQKAIEPYNTVGLLSSEPPHMYEHTTADL